MTHVVWVLRIRQYLWRINYPKIGLGGWTIIFLRWGGIGQLFSTGIFVRDQKLCMNVISLACNIFLCFVHVPLCTMFICSAKVVQDFFFRICPPPPSTINDAFSQPVFIGDHQTEWKLFSINIFIGLIEVHNQTKCYFLIACICMNIQTVSRNFVQDRLTYTKRLVDRESFSSFLINRPSLWRPPVYKMGTVLWSWSVGLTYEQSAVKLAVRVLKSGTYIRRMRILVCWMLRSCVVVF